MFISDSFDLDTILFFRSINNANECITNKRSIFIRHMLMMLLLRVRYFSLVCVFFLLLLQLLLLVCFLLWCEGATRQIFTERYAQDYNWISYIMSVTRVNAGLLAASYLPNLYTRLHLNQVNAHETKWFLATSCCIQWNLTMEFHTCLSNRF